MSKNISLGRPAINSIGHIEEINIDSNRNNISVKMIVKDCGIVYRHMTVEYAITIGFINPNAMLKFLPEKVGKIRIDAK